MTCTHIYLSNPPPPHELIKFYSTVHLHTEADAARQGAPHARNGALRPHRWKSWLRRIRVRPHSWPSAPAPPEGKRLLDLGCGDGVKLIEFAQRMRQFTSSFALIGAYLPAQILEGNRAIIEAFKKRTNV